MVSMIKEVYHHHPIWPARAIMVVLAVLDGVNFREGLKSNSLEEHKIPFRMRMIQHIKNIFTSVSRYRFRI